MSSNEDYVLVPRSSVKGEIKGVQASSSSVVTPSATASFSPSVGIADDKSKEQSTKLDFKLESKSLASMLSSPKLRSALGSSSGRGKPFTTDVTYFSTFSLSATATPFSHEAVVVSNAGEWSQLGTVFEEYKVIKVRVTWDFCSLFTSYNGSTTSTLGPGNARGVSWVSSVTHEPFDGSTPSFATEIDRSESKILQVNPAHTLFNTVFVPKYCYSYDSTTSNFTSSSGWQATALAAQHQWCNARLSASGFPVWNNQTVPIVKIIRCQVMFRHRK